MKIVSEILAHSILKALAPEMGRAYSAAKEWGGQGQVQRFMGLAEGRGRRRRRNNTPGREPRSAREQSGSWHARS